MLERRGLIERDIESVWLAAGAEPGPLDWAFPDFPDTEIRWDDDLGGGRWEGESSRPSSSSRLSSWYGSAGWQCGGRRYKLTLKLDDGASTAQYQAAFTSSQEWKTLRFQPADFRASFRGRAVAAPPVQFRDLRYVGLLISDKQSGAFRIELKEIRTVADGSEPEM